MSTESLFKPFQYKNLELKNRIVMAPLTIAANDHRPAYSSDGDYFSKPSSDDMVERIYAMFNETNPQKYPAIF